MYNNNEHNKHLVSIVCDVFNHEDYLRDCLEGLVKQRTNFDYIILIHDDASTDSSPKIINEYVNKYPHLFMPLFQKENQHSKGIGIWKTYQFPRIHTKYVAFCEGDDYWTDSMKLQKEVDFLESHPECTAVYGNIIVRDETLTPIQEKRSSEPARYVSKEEVLGGMLFPIGSVCVRHIVIDNWSDSIQANGDMILSYISTSIGNAYIMDDCMSVYRRTGKGISTSRDHVKQLIAELKEWYLFHKQLCFPVPYTLILFQSKSIARFISKEGLKKFPIKKIIKYIRTSYLPLYIYYMSTLLYKHIKNTLKLKFQTVRYNGKKN